MFKKRAYIYTDMKELFWKHSFKGKYEQKRKHKEGK